MNIKCVWRRDGRGKKTVDLSEINKMNKTTWKGKYRSMDNTTIGKEDIVTKKIKRSPMKGTHKHMEA